MRPDPVRTFRRLRSRALGSLNRRVHRHLGCERPPSLSRSYPPYLAKDAAIAWWSFLGLLGAETVGYRGDWRTLLESVELERDPGDAPPDLARFETDAGEVHQGLERGLAFLRWEGAALVVYAWSEEIPRDAFQLRVAAADESQADLFLAAFGAHLDERRVFSRAVQEQAAQSLNAAVREHLGEAAGRLPTQLQRSYPRYQIPSVAILIKDFLAERGARLYGLPSSRSFERQDLLELLDEPRISDYGNFEGEELKPAELERISLTRDEVREGLTLGLALLHEGGSPLLLACLKTTDYDPSYDLAILAYDAAAASSLLEAFETYERERSVFRGRLLRPLLSYRDEVQEAHIIDHPPVAWDQIVLPDALRATIEAEVIDYARCAPRLAEAGVEVKRGILLHGPPGTGKTHMCRVLASVLEGFTGIVLAGDSLDQPAAAFALARKLAPALIFFEDVDLIARDREANGASAVLGTLLNELDGLEPSEQIFCVFTTNRLEVLEDALAQRPGRVDLVLEFPLPSADLRRRLLELYAGRADLSGADLDAIAHQTEGVTPAFLRELIKQAAFQALRGDDAPEPGAPLALSDAHLEGALAALRERCGDASLERILGFRVGQD